MKALGGPEQHGKRIGKAIDEYVERFDGQRSSLSIHYKLLLIERCRPFLEKKTFDQLDTRTILQLYDELSKQSAKGALSENSIKRIQSDLRHFFNRSIEVGFIDELPKFPRIKTQASRRPHFDSKAWRTLVRHLREFIKVTNRKTLRDRSMFIQ